MNTTSRVTWHRYPSGIWRAEAGEFAAEARPEGGAWWLTVYLFGRRANGSGDAARFRTLAEAKAEAQLWADTTAEALA